MSSMIANIPVSLSEVLQPSDLGRFLDLSAKRGQTPGEVLAVAIRHYLTTQDAHATLPASAAAKTTTLVAASGA